MAEQPKSNSSVMGGASQSGRTHFFNAVSLKGSRKPLNTEDAFVDMALRAWKLNIDRTGKFFSRGC
jgi:hypothetical protein